VVSFDRLVVASFLDALTVRRGKAVRVRYVSTTAARVVLEVFKGSRRVAAVGGRAKEGRNSIRWNGKVSRKAAAAGRYKLVLRATSGAQLVTDRASVRIVGGKAAKKKSSGGGGNTNPTPPLTGGGDDG
jgi:recombinational DNA repair ATPase RecF